jgi:hypothetical protein
MMGYWLMLLLERSFSYIVSFDSCSDSTHTYTPLVVEVAVNQDYVEVSQLVGLAYRSRSPNQRK